VDVDSPGGSDLPAGEDVGDTGAAFVLLQGLLREITERVRRIETHVGIEGDEE
jgi:hypothetical protein